MKNIKPLVYLAAANRSLSLEFGCVDSNGGGEKEIEQRDSKITNKNLGAEPKFQ
jgi:hypothetical protein